MKHDVLVFTDRNIVMQRLMDAVNNKCHLHQFGKIPVSKIADSVATFEHDYHAFDDKNERAKRKRLGLASIHAVLWRDKKDPDRIQYWLLAPAQSAGRHPIHSNKLKNVLKPGERIEIDGFELVRLPKEGTSESKLSWRMTDTKYQAWRNYIIDAVRSQSHPQMQNMLYQLWSSPGFNGVRKQVGNLIVLYKAEVKRASIKNAPTPPKRLFYLRRVLHIGINVKALVKQKRICSPLINCTDTKV